MALASFNLAGSVLGAIGGILVARYIGPEVNGQFRVFTIPLMYLTFLHLGTFDGLQRQIPFFVGSGQPELVEKVASASGAWNLFASSVVAAGFLICAIWSLWRGNNADAAGWFSQVFVCASVFYGGYLGATYRTMHNFGVLARIQFVQTIIGFCLIATVAMWGFYGLCLRAAIPGIVAVWLCHFCRPLQIKLNFDFAVLKSVLKIGIPLCFWGILYTAVWTGAEFTLIKYLGGVKELGMFSVAVIMREAMLILPQSIHQVFMPQIVEAYARDGGRITTNKLSFTVAGVSVILVALAVLIASMALDYFVPNFIPKYNDGLALMKICLWYAVIQAASLPLNALVANGKGWLQGRGVLAGMIVFPLAVYALYPLWGGGIGVVVGSLIGRLARTVVAYIDLFILTQDQKINQKVSILVK